MFWLRDKKNSFLLHTLSWGPELCMGKSIRIQRVNKDMFCSVQQDCIMNQVEKIYEAVLLSTQIML